MKELIRIDLVAAVPEIFESALNSSMIKLAIEKGLVNIVLHNLHDYAALRFFTALALGTAFALYPRFRSGGRGLAQHRLLQLSKTSLHRPRDKRNIRQGMLVSHQTKVEAIAMRQHSNVKITAGQER